MSYLVVGKKHGSFPDERGEIVSYSQLHCIGDFETKNGEGQECSIFKKKDEHFFDNVQVNSEVEIFFDKYGKVKKVEVVSQ